jgi:hypothetical protein
MNDIDQVRVVYKYKARFVALAWVLGLGPLSIFLGVATILQQGWLDGLPFLLGGLSFVLVIGWILVMSLADVCIDDQQILRRAFGITWQRMRWTDAARLTIVPSMNPENGQPARTFVLRASKGAGAFFFKTNTLSRTKVGHEHPFG